MQSCRSLLAPVSVLCFGQVDDDAVELRPHLDLAGETRVVAHFGRELQHLRFRLGRRRTYGCRPRSVHMNMACCACTRAAAVGIDARYSVRHRAAHEGRAVLDLDRVCSAVELYVCHAT